MTKSTAEMKDDGTLEVSSDVNCKFDERMKTPPKNDTALIPDINYLWTQIV